MRVPDFRVIPSIDELRQRPRVVALEQAHGSQATMTALRQAAAELRAALASGTSATDLPNAVEEAAVRIEGYAERHLTAQFRGSLRRVINATGIVIHTNLGRAPLPASALARISEVASGYCNLEYDLEEGVRGSRTAHAEPLLTALTGAEAAVVVNNNAAATMLILAALASGREVVVSRGELVEIGGGFRVPDVMAQSGATLREVGTTNRTRVTDYRAALGPRTALMLRVHPSNFTMEGFTERPSLHELVHAAREAQIPLVEDLGSGCLIESLKSEPSVQASVAAGADLVCFSGDKLLGGPQAGIIVGRRELVQQLARHPLMRALRVDKLTLAALEATLIEHLGGRVVDTVPVLRMIETGANTIEARARELAARLTSNGWQVAVMSGVSAIGGGSAPGVELPTVLVAARHPDLSVTALERRLRSLDPPVIARIESDQLVLDLRTVLDDQDNTLADLLASIRADQAR